MQGNILEVNVPNAISIGLMFGGLVLLWAVGKKLMGNRRMPISNTPRASWPASGGA